MQKYQSRLTVYFEDPFWVGVYERIDGDRMEVCRIVFGAEPKDYDVYELLQKSWHTLRFGPPVQGLPAKREVGNPKRHRREIKRQLSQKRGVGTKAQQAIKLQQEEGKRARKQKSRQKREAEKERQFQCRQEKKKEKQKGH